MELIELLFVLAAALVVYTYFLYPLIVVVLGRLWTWKTQPRHAVPQAVSVIISAYNEEATIGARIQEFTDTFSACALDGEVIVVSDGSTDKTALTARMHSSGAVRVIELAANVGKAAALSRGCAEAQKEIIVFADARQTWSPQAMSLLLENFSNPRVGGASGDLVIECLSGVLAGVGLYWRLEKLLRRAEGRIHSTVGVTGSISAVRRSLFRPIPSRTILDDVYWPLQVVMQGYRVVHDQRARAFDCLPAHTGGEFRRKVRTLAGNYQLISRLPGALLPWRNPICFQFLSHKLCRLMVPWALLALLFLSSLHTSPLLAICFWAQLAFYTIGLAGLAAGHRIRFRPVAFAGSFLVLNSAAWVAFWVWVSGRADQSWKKVAYVDLSPPFHSLPSTLATPPHTAHIIETAASSPAPVD
jgi:cellulose synthase/poly-beta-1,6-N-acetylglucosamine synthase-like glycosyltransferase